MGLTFRYGSYKRRVYLGKRTIKDGEAAIVWNRFGESREIRGPKLERMFMSVIQFLNRYVAKPGQYLEIYFRSGNVKNLSGPVELFLNPTIHESVQVKTALCLPSASHVLLVQCTDPTDSNSAGKSVQAARGAPSSSNSLGAVLPAETLAPKVSSASPESSIGPQAGSCSLVQSPPNEKPPNVKSDRLKVVHGPLQYFPCSDETIFDLNYISNALEGNRARANENLPSEGFILYVGSRSIRNTFEARRKDGMRCSIVLDCKFFIKDPLQLQQSTREPLQTLTNALRQDLLHLFQQYDVAKALEAAERCEDHMKYARQVFKSIGLVLQETSVADSSGLDEILLEQAARAKSTKLEEERTKMAALERKELLERAVTEEELERKKMGQEARQLEEKAMLRRRQLEMVIQDERIKSEANLAIQSAINAQKLEFLRELKLLDVDITRVVVGGEKKKENPDIMN